MQFDLIGAFDVVGTVLSGWLTDRFDSRWLLFWYYGVRGLSLLLLPIAFGGCSFSSSNPPPPKNNTTIVVPPGSTVVCSNGAPPPCQ